MLTDQDVSKRSSQTLLGGAQTLTGNVKVVGLDAGELTMYTRHNWTILSGPSCSSGNTEISHEKAQLTIAVAELTVAGKSRWTRGMD